MANNTETVAVKTEFVDVVTEGELLLSPISATFSTIITEASLVKVPPAEGLINEKTITTLYNKDFVDAMSYRAFTENKLRPWENALEYKHFDTMYTNHQSLVNTIRKLCQQAQALLEKPTYSPEGTLCCNKKSRPMYPRLPGPNYAKDCVNLHCFVSKKCLSLPLSLKHPPHHSIYQLVNTVSII